MNRYRTFILFLILFIISGNQSYSQTSQAKTTGLAFLKLGVGGRASGLGEAYTAVADDATATYWNPAGLTLVKTAQIVFSHNEWIQDISNDFFAYSFPAFKGAIGLSFYSINVGGIERRVKPGESLGTVGAHDIAFGLSYGHTFSPAIRAGVTLKYLYEKIYLDSATGFAFDLGFIFKPFESPLKFALVVQNIGSMNELREKSIDLPEILRLGASYKLDIEALEGAIILAVDVIKVVGTELNGDPSIKENFGAEIQMKGLVAFRVGYQTGHDARKIGAGFGLIYKRYHIDYGYSPFDSNLGDGHRFSFGLDL